MRKRFQDLHWRWVFQSRLSTAVFILGVVIIIYAILGTITIHKYATYTSPKYGIQMKFPANWGFREVEAPGSIITVFPAPENSLDTFTENVTLTYWDLMDETMSFARFSNKAAEQMALMFSGEIKVLQSQRFSLQGRQWYRFAVIGTNPAATDPMQALFVWTIVGRRAFIFTYVAQRSTYNKYSGAAERIFRSFGPLQQGKK